MAKDVKEKVTRARKVVTRPGSPQLRRYGRKVVGGDQFTPAIFRGLVEDMNEGRLPVDRVTVSDNMIRGLRATIRKTGMVSLAAHPNMGDGKRPYITLGHWPAMSVPIARKLAQTIQALADEGIDVAEASHERLIRELKEQGVNWRPS